MNIAQLTAGTGTWYCGSCLRDNTLAMAQRALGHEVVVVPMYLPLFTDEPDAAGDAKVFFGGVNVYLQQKSAVFRALPKWLDGVFDSRPMLRLAARASGMTAPESLGELTISMLRGTAGHQAKEIDFLASSLAARERPDLVVLSNALLAGLARPLKERLGVPVACTLQGEAPFLDVLPEAERREAWSVLAESARAVDGFVSVSRWHAEEMSARLALDPAKVHVVHNGITLEGFDAAPPEDPPVLGYFARLCRDKGLPVLIDAWLHLRRRASSSALRLRLGGAMTGLDVPLVDALKARIEAAGLGSDVEWHPNVDRLQKQAFLRGLTVFSVPATYGESFGLYAVEALASGVPVVAPRHGAFPELLEATGGGLLVEPDDPLALADGIEQLVTDRARAAALGAAGRRAVHERFGANHMAQAAVDAYSRIIQGARTRPGEVRP